jgi:hypothetical protein
VQHNSKWNGNNGNVCYILTVLIPFKTLKCGAIWVFKCSMKCNYLSLYDSEYQTVVFWVMTLRTFNGGYVTDDPSTETLATTHETG